MRTPAILPIATALIAAVALSMPAGARTFSKSTAAKCSKVYDDCASSPLCHSSNQAIRQQCLGRCLNKQLKCTGSPIMSSAGSAKEGKGGGKPPKTVAKPTVQQPTKSIGTSGTKGTKGTSQIVGNAVKQPTKTIGTSPILRGGRPSQNRK